MISNEEMALLIKEGPEELIPALWDNVKLFVYLNCNRYYNNNKRKCEAAGVEPDDLRQEGYFAVLKAIESYDNMSGYKFITFMSYPLKNTFNELTGQRKKRLLNDTISLDAPIKSDDDLILLDTVKDKRDYIEDIDDRLYNETLHNDLELALKDLDCKEETVIRYYYYKGYSDSEIAKELNINPKTATYSRKRGLNALMRSKRLKEYREDIISQYAYKSSFSSWYFKGISSVELTVMKLAEKGRARF